jgi:hypothetical protein
MSEEVINDYVADAELAPKRRGRPPKIEETPAATLTVEDAPPVDAPEPVDERKLTAATRLEMEVGRKVLEGYK